MADAVFLSRSPAETEAIAAAIAERLHAGDLLALRGGLGAGKTAFVRGLAAGLRVRGEVASPTYALVNVYEGTPPLFHFDMYRITDPDELYTTGFFDYLEQGGIVAVEWSENITHALPANALFIDIQPLSETERRITVHGDERF